MVVSVRERMSSITVEESKMKNVSNDLVMAFNAEWLMLRPRASDCHGDDEGVISWFVQEKLKCGVDFFALCCASQDDSTVRQETVERLADHKVPIFQGYLMDDDTEAVKCMDGARESSDVQFLLVGTYSGDNAGREESNHFSIADGISDPFRIYDMAGDKRRDFISGMTVLMSCRYVYGYIPSMKRFVTTSRG